MKIAFALVPMLLAGASHAAREIEYKYQIGSGKKLGTLNAISHSVNTIEGFRLTHKYKTPHVDYVFDTPAGDLKAEGLKLRIRWEHGRYMVEFKGKNTPGSGPGQDGQWSREESEPVAIDEELFNAIVEKRASQEQLLGLAPFKLVAEHFGRLPSLERVLRIKTKRTNLRLQNEKDEREHMEIALDSIFFVDNKGRRVVDSEVEIEKQSAQEADQKRVAERLSKDWNLIPSTEAKEVRGQRLLAEKVLPNKPEYDKTTGLLEVYARIRALLTTQKTVFVFIAGKSNSGKTSQFVEKLSGLLNGPAGLVEGADVATMKRPKKQKLAVTLSIDNYYHNQPLKRPGVTNYDQPEAVELSLVEEKLGELRKMQPIVQPIYSFRNGGERTGSERMDPARVVLVEGLFALDDRFKKYSDIGVMINIDSHSMLLRGLMRDGGKNTRTGENFKEALARYLTTVIPMNREHVTPTEKNADLIIRNDYNPAQEGDRAGRFESHLKVRADDVVPDSVLRLGGHHLGMLTQKDTFYVPKGSDFKKSKELLRVREEGNERTLTYKGPWKNVDVPSKPRIDILTELDEKLLPSFEKEYDRGLIVEKERRLFDLGKGLLLALDDVKDAGSFVEFQGINRDNRDHFEKWFSDLGLQGKRMLNQSYFELVSSAKASSQPVGTANTVGKELE